jgi:hypothetical protein
VERLLDYVKHNAPHLKLEKVKPGVLKLVKIPEKKRPTPHNIKLKKQNDKPKKVKPKGDLHDDNYWSIKENKDEKVDFEPKHPKAKGPMIHFDLSSISKDKPDLMAKAVHVYKDGPPQTAAVVHDKKAAKSGMSKVII